MKSSRTNTRKYAPENRKLRRHGEIYVRMSDARLKRRRLSEITPSEKFMDMCPVPGSIIVPPGEISDDQITASWRNLHTDVRCQAEEAMA